MKLSQLLEALPHLKLKKDVDIHRLTLDSRSVKTGDLFFAYSGTQVDGRRFIPEAIQKGVSAIIKEDEVTSIDWQGDVPVISLSNFSSLMGNMVSLFYGKPSHLLEVVGITGTNGKTSCSHFIARLLQLLGVPCGVIGTLGSGIYPAIQAGSLTTPDVITLQHTFADFVAKKARAVAMEVSSHSLEQGRVQGVEFDIGVFTNLTRDHLDYHGTMQAYGNAKKKLFEMDSLHSAVINTDDPFGVTLVNEIAPLKKVITYGLNPLNASGAYPEVTAKDVQLSLKGISAKLETPWGRGEFDVPLIGAFNLSNILASLASLCLLGFSLDDVLSHLPQLISVPGRMQRFGGGVHPLVVVDYAHTPDALEKVLLALRAHSNGKIYCLFGCGGDRDRGKRPLMAKIAEKYTDYIVVSDDNPRHENPDQIAKDIFNGFRSPEKVHLQHDRAKAIKEVLELAKAGDSVLIAGKGAETYQVVGDQKIPFSDVEVVKTYLSL